MGERTKFRSITINLRADRIDRFKAYCKGNGVQMSEIISPLMDQIVDGELCVVIQDGKFKFMYPERMTDAEKNATLEKIMGGESIKWK